MKVSGFVISFSFEMQIVLYYVVRTYASSYLDIPRSLCTDGIPFQRRAVQRRALFHVRLYMIFAVRRRFHRPYIISSLRPYVRRTDGLILGAEGRGSRLKNTNSFNASAGVKGGENMKGNNSGKCD